MKKKINVRPEFVAMAIAAITALLWNITSFAVTCEQIRNDCVRLHIVANSDSEADQSAKLKVRDRVLQLSRELRLSEITAETAVEILTPQLEKIEEAASDELQKCSMDYGAKAYIDYEYFDTREYDGEIVLPAGKYLAVKIILGAGEGKNWWCVIFPSLCLPAAREDAVDAFSQDEKHIITQPQKYAVRFKIVEYFEKLRNLAEEK